jgi:serine-type D-Ala-D-Ala carboxypeptidase (penicillin-binding protein 5/6)
MKRFFLLYLATLLGFPFAASAIETAAKQAFLIDAATHTVLLNKDGDVQMHPSSMSKLMTIYILFSRLKEGRVKMDSKFLVSEKAWSTQGSKSFVGIGSEIAVENLIHGIITQSGNDACIVVAEGISGSEEAFVEEMNKVAADMGLTHSHFTNATGMPDDNHVMSARDLAMLSERLILDFPEYYHLFAVREYTYNNIKQQNRNRLLSSNIGVDGLKTGHTEAGGYGITLSAVQNGRRLILVINGMKDDKERVQEGDSLLRWGFREFENHTLVHKGQTVSDADVWFGNAAIVPLVTDQDLVITLPAGSKKDVKFMLNYEGPLQAPVAKGTHVANLAIAIPGSEPHIVPLLAGEDVAKLSGFSHAGAVLSHIFHRSKP